MELRQRGQARSDASIRLNLNLGSVGSNPLGIIVWRDDNRRRIKLIRGDIDDPVADFQSGMALPFTAGKEAELGKFIARDTGTEYRVQMALVLQYPLQENAGSPTGVGRRRFWQGNAPFKMPGRPNAFEECSNFHGYREQGVISQAHLHHHHWLFTSGSSDRSVASASIWRSRVRVRPPIFSPVCSPKTLLSTSILRLSKGAGPFRRGQRRRCSS